MSESKAALGFLAGIAVGALAGLLLAPEKGADLRSKIAGKASDVTDSVKSSLDSAVDHLKSAYKGGKAEAEALGDKASRKYNETKADVQNSFS